MIELWENINDKTKEYAEQAWTLAIAMLNPADAANFLNDITNNYIGTQKEVDFLRFYFNMKMEMIKK